MMAMMAAMCMTGIVACGGDEIDENTPSLSDERQRIEVTITGDISTWNILCAYSGYLSRPEVDTTCIIRCNQSEEVYDLHTNELINGDTYALVIPILSRFTRTYPITATLYGDSNLLLKLDAMPTEDISDAPWIPVTEITITIKGYKGNKLTNSYAKTVNENMTFLINFLADKNDEGKDWLRELDYYDL